MDEGALAGYWMLDVGGIRNRKGKNINVERFGGRKDLKAKSKGRRVERSKSKNG